MGRILLEVTLRDGVPCSINPDHVRYITEGIGTGCLINLGPQDGIEVRENYAKIQERLEDALE
jgi:hypothetical protein